MVSQQVAPSVVHIDVRGAIEPAPAKPAPRPFRMPPHDLEGQGSGVIVDPQGYLLTNLHVVSGAREIRVTLSDGRGLRGRTIGVNPLTDLAVVKIEAEDLVAAAWGDSEALHPGAMVWALGSPFGLQSTITFGIVSGKHRSAVAGDVYQDFLQTDAAVNPGNSGGPLVDSRGHIVGINTAILGEAYRGVSFAIPSSVARQVYERLKNEGQVARGWLGVELRAVEDQDVTRYRLPGRRGALVSTIIDDPQLPRPAKEAGMRRGDVILRWNGQAVESPAELIRQVGMTEIGAAVAVVVWREGQELPLEIRVAERPKFIDS